MFWYLYLAHFLADYPLQPMRLVLAKRHWKGLTVHVAIHLVVMLLIAGAFRRTLWPYLLLITGIHFSIDAFKNFLATRRPHWIIGPYFFDQFLHLLSLIGVAAWINQALPAASRPPAAVWPVYALGYLLATHPWYVTERIVHHADEAYLRELDIYFWWRNAGRVLLLSLFLWSWQALLAGGVGLAVAAVQLPYLSGDYRRRTLLVDVAGAFLLALLVQLALRL